jgi:hypothetical protein
MMLSLENLGMDTEKLEENVFCFQQVLGSLYLVAFHQGS